MQTVAKQPMSVKKTYGKPRLTVHGDAGKITKMLGTGSYLDAPFPAGTFKEALTFSP
jgi:hypothetical protein